MVRLDEEAFSQDRYYHPRPGPGGEKVPVQILNFTRVFAAWSPELKATLFLKKLLMNPKHTGLKGCEKLSFFMSMTGLREGKG